MSNEAVPLMTPRPTELPVEVQGQQWHRFTHWVLHWWPLLVLLAALLLILGWWLMTRRAEDRCRSCSEAADCAATGHQWSSWRNHHTDTAIRWRVCNNCRGAFEERFADMDGEP